MEMRERRLGVGVGGKGGKLVAGAPVYDYDFEDLWLG